MLTGDRAQDRAEYLRLAAHEKAYSMRQDITADQAVIALRCQQRYERLAGELA